ARASRRVGRAVPDPRRFPCRGTQPHPPPRSGGGGPLRRGRGSSPLAQALAGGHDRERRYMSLWGVVPAFNEEERIEATVAALYAAVGCDRVVVVDDGSHDATGERAARAGAVVVALPRNGGKGRALRRGIQEVLQGDMGVDVALLADADLGPAAARLVPLVQAVREQGKDLAIASFSSRGGFGVVKKIAAAGIYRLTGRL